MTDFSRFESEYVINAILEFESCFRIGGGQHAANYSISSSPVIQYYDETMGAYFPVIPGSSLKGVLRSGFERLVRSFNMNESCVALSDENNEKRLCGRCITCRLFGSMESGSAIFVEDAFPSERESGMARILYTVKEQPHHGIPFGVNGKFRANEVVAKSTRFDLKLAMQNVEPREVGLILLTLEEFNHRRLQIGGETSRGLGFVSAKDIRVVAKRLEHGSLSTEEVDAARLKEEGRRFLREIYGKPGRQAARTRDFSTYATDALYEVSVYTMELRTVKPFRMPGIEEQTVTNLDEPYIPGSTIKGFMRKNYKGPNSNEIFGSTDKKTDKKTGKRSRVLVSDAFLVDDNGEEGRGISDMIPPGKRLRCWIVFDNMHKDEITNVLQTIMNKKVQITGNVSAGKSRNNPEPTHNIVHFSEIGRETFRAEDYLRPS